jgi:hypothetical protein
MKDLRKVSRRSFMTRVVGGAIAGGGALVALSGRAEALQVTDRDTGSNSDSPGRGYTGYSDSDSGNGSDRANHGRSRQRTAARGCTDNDSGSNADGVGNGRGNGVTDNDSGSNADRAGCGRGH